MKITTLIENSRLPGRKDLKKEHGLSLHIHHDGQQILFDTGSSGAFLENAEKTGINIQEADLLVLSHHHRDHTGGLARFLQINQKALVYLRQEQQGQQYFRIPGIFKINIGLDKQLLASHRHRFRFIEEFTEITPEVFIITSIGTQHALPRGNRHLYLRQEDRFLPDPFDHELIVVINQEDDLVVFTGCSHWGILNMTDSVKRHFPHKKIKLVMGGFHLIDLPLLGTMAGSKEQLEKLAGQLMKLPVERWYTGHCTGKKAFTLLKGVMGERLHPFSTGDVIETTSQLSQPKANSQ